MTVLSVMNGIHTINSAYNILQYIYIHMYIYYTNRYINYKLYQVLNFKHCMNFFSQKHHLHTETDMHTCARVYAFSCSLVAVPRQNVLRTMLSSHMSPTNAGKRRAGRAGRALKFTSFWLRFTVCFPRNSAGRLEHQEKPDRHVQVAPEEWTRGPSIRQFPPEKVI